MKCALDGFTKSFQDNRYRMYIRKIDNSNIILYKILCPQPDTYANTEIP